MKTFKPKLALLASIGSVLALCVLSASAAGLTEPVSNASLNTAPAAAVIDGGSTLDKIRAAGVINLGIREKALPFSDIEAGVAKGYSVDICNRVADGVIGAIGKPVRVAYVAVNAKNRIEMLKNGLIDIECGTTTHTAAREKEVAFSLPIFVSGVRLAVRNDAAGLATSLDNFGGKTIAVVAGSTAEGIVKRAEVAAAVNGRKFTIKQIGNNDEGIKAVSEGAAQAFATDDVLLASAIAKQGLFKSIVRVGPLMSVEPYAFMVRKKDDIFEKLVDKAVRDVLVSGAALGFVDKWLNTPELQYTLNALTRENFRFSTKFAAP